MRVLKTNVLLMAASVLMSVVVSVTLPSVAIAASEALVASRSVMGLSLQAAEQFALQRDLLSKSFRQNEQAFDEQAIASNTWADPRVKFGAQAVPIDTFNLDQEAMTQVIVGYQQMLPRGDSLVHAAQSMQAMARTQSARAQQRDRAVLMRVRQVWLEVVLQMKSLEIIKENRVLFEQMLDISQAWMIELNAFVLTWWLLRLI